MHGSNQLPSQNTMSTQDPSIRIPKLVTFPTGTKPLTTWCRPEIIAFWEGYIQAFSTTLCISWRISGELPTWSTSLMTAKARVAPLKGISSVRAEICGAVLKARLILTVFKNPREGCPS